MKQAFEIIRASRKQMVIILDNLSLAQLNQIPEGFNNNIVWNIAHVVAVQESLTYGLSGLRWTSPKALVKGYARGTVPVDPVDADFVSFLKSELVDSIDRLQTNYKAGNFKEYQHYDLSLGYTVRSVEDAIHFNIYHEALHMGAIINMRKFVQ